MHGVGRVGVLSQRYGARGSGARETPTPRTEGLGKDTCGVYKRSFNQTHVPKSTIFMGYFCKRAVYFCKVSV